MRFPSLSMLILVAALCSVSCEETVHDTGLADDCSTDAHQAKKRSTLDADPTDVTDRLYLGEDAADFLGDASPDSPDKRQFRYGKRQFRYGKRQFRYGKRSDTAGTNAVDHVTNKRSTVDSDPDDVTLPLYLGEETADLIGSASPDSAVKRQFRYGKRQFRYGKRQFRYGKRSDDDVFDSNLDLDLPASEDKRGSLFRFGKRQFRYGKRQFRYGKRSSLFRFGKRGGALFRFGRSSPDDVTEKQEILRQLLSGLADEEVQKRDAFHWGSDQ